jgi:hypothetical protein
VPVKSIGVIENLEIIRGEVLAGKVGEVMGVDVGAVQNQGLGLVVIVFAPSAGRKYHMSPVSVVST